MMNCGGQRYILYRTSLCVARIYVHTSGDSAIVPPRSSDVCVHQLWLTQTRDYRLPVQYTLATTIQVHTLHSMNMNTRNRETFAWFNRRDGAALLINVHLCCSVAVYFALSEAVVVLYAYDGSGLGRLRWRSGKTEGSSIKNRYLITCAQWRWNCRNLISY